MPNLESVFLVVTFPMGSSRGMAITPGEMEGHIGVNSKMGNGVGK
jgi:hypothetical protein